MELSHFPNPAFPAKLFVDSATIDRLVISSGDEWTGGPAADRWMDGMGERKE